MRVLETSPIMEMFQKMGTLALAATGKQNLSSVDSCLPAPSHL